MTIKKGIIVTGRAYDKGRAPSHDGEYISVWYVPGDDRYIAEDNGGVAWTVYDATDVLAEADFDPTLDRQIQEAGQIVATDDGEDVTIDALGSEAADIARKWGWR